MLIDILPTEVLLFIFENLNDKDLVSCNQVCRHWRDAIDGLPDTFWRRFCDQNYWCTRTDREKTNLPKNFNSLCPLYRDLYKSLSLWPEIETATMHLNKCPFIKVSHYKILNNTILAILPDTDDTYSNEIIYYDLETFEQRDRQCFNFLFHMYDENESMITVVDVDGNLHVMSKANKKCYLAGTLQGADMVDYGEYKLLEDRLYFHDDKKGILHVCKLNDINGELIVQKADKRRPFAQPKIVAFTDCHGGNIFYLLSDGNLFYYDAEKKQSEIKIKIVHLEDYGFNTYVVLTAFGLDWSCPSLYNWLKNNIDYEITYSRIINVDTEIFCRHGNIVILGTVHTIHIYVNPYDTDGMLILNSKTPDKSIGLLQVHDNMENLDIYMRKRIKKMDVIEIQNGHRILVLYGNELLNIDLIHEDLQNV